MHRGDTEPGIVRAPSPCAMRATFGEPHLVEPQLRYAVWWTRPHGLVATMLEPSRIDDSLCDFITGPLYEAAMLRGAGEPLFVLHDWSRATGYDGLTRLRMVKWLLTHQPDFAGVGVVQPSGSSILRMAAQVGDGLLAGSGVPFSLVDTVAEFVSRHGLVRADASTPTS